MIHRGFILVILLSVVNTKYMEGELNTGDNWAFLARFCFLSLHGKFEYDIEYPEVRTKGSLYNVHALNIV